MKFNEGTIRSSQTEVYKSRLKSILLANGYEGAAKEINEIIRKKSDKQIYDVIELWKQWANQGNWFENYDKVSTEHKWKRFLR